MSREDGSFSNLGFSSDVWHRVWKLDTPPKIKDLMWRALKNVVPTKINLRSKGVDVDERCLFCPSRETMDHLFLFCPYAIEV